MDYEYTAWLKANEERKYYECDPEPAVENFDDEDGAEFDREYRLQHG